MIVAGKNFLLLVYCVVVVIGQQRQPLALADTPNTPSSHDKATVDALERALLGLFGMTSRPRPNRKVHIPQYMYELYKEQTGMDLRLDMDAVASRRKPLYSANTIRSFHDEPTEEFHSGPVVDSNRATLLFNISSVRDTETLKGAELRVYRQQSNSTHQDMTDDELRELASQQHRIDIYEIVRPATRTREAITRLVDTRTVRPHRTAWESFDISAATARWKSSPHLNFGLQVHFSTKTGQPSRLQHVRLKRSVAMQEQEWHSQKPILVTYSDDGNSAPEQSHSRSRRASKHRRNKRRMGHKKKRDLCRKRKLYVDFGEVGWNDWIVAPPGYNAFYCHGTCPSVMADTMNSTNHAIVQSFVHAVSPEAVPKPCCVPTELSAISLLYVNEKDQVELKKYNDMVVQSCGCR